MKDIVIIANFCRDFSEADNGRFMYLCKELSKEHKVEIITSDFSHGKKTHKEPLKVQWPFKITFLHEMGYKKNISFRRFLSHRAWGKEVEKYLKMREKPDVIYCAVPSLTAPYAAAKYCEKNNVRFIIDIQDLWPEAFKMAFNIPIISDLIFSPFTYLANEIYKRADEIVAVSDTYGKRALSVNNKTKAYINVYLGTKMEKFDDAVCKFRENKETQDIRLGYCGSLSYSYDIRCVLDAMSILINEKSIKNIKFIVMGDGPLKDKFEQYAKDKNVNVEFTGRLDYEKMCSKIAACDIAINPISHGAAQSIINKHGDYAMAGIPVVSTQECEEYKELVTSYQMGFNCKNGDAHDLADKIKILIEDECLREKMGDNARRCAAERFDRKKSYLPIIEIVA